MNTGTVLDRSLIRVDSVELNGSDFKVKIQVTGPQLPASVSG